MSSKIFLLLFIISLVLIPSNGRKADEENPFRMVKLNMIWRKAQNKMSQQKLQDFRHVLEMQDRAEIRWKEVKASGGDEDGEMESMLRMKFSRVLQQFHLEDHFDDMGNDIRDKRAGTEGQGVFNDKRLSELWESAQAKFSPEELNDLQTEFQHHKDKLKEYKHLVDILKNSESISENSIHRHTKFTDQERESVYNKLHDTHETLTKDFMRLKEKVTGGKEEFQDPRVTELWERAKRAQFNQEELDSIKEELKHFERKINKHKHYVEELGDSARLVREGHDHLKEKHDSLVEKAKEHARWVKKMHATLMNKVTKNEL